MLSQGFNYRMKGAESSAGVISRKKTIFPKQSLFEAGNKIELQVPSIPRSFLDLKNSYLKFTIKNKTGAGSAQFDNSAYCLFEKITVSSKGLILDELQNCASYYALTNSFEVHPFSGYDDIIGLSSDYKLPWVGQSIVSEKTFILPFTHGLFNSTKYLPMFSQAGVKLEFLLNQVDKCILANTAANAAFEISNVEFVYPCLTMDQETFNSLNGSVESYDLDIVSTHLHTVAVNQNSKRENHEIPSRFSNVNTVLLLMRDTSDSSTVNKVKYSTRHANNLESIQYKHAGNLYPSQPLKRSTNGNDNVDATDFSNQKSRISSEMFIESLSTYKSINSNFFLQRGNSFVLRAKGEPSVDQTTDGDLLKNVNTYEREDGSITETLGANGNEMSSSENFNVGTFFVAIPFSTYKSPELNATILSGANTVSDSIFVDLNFANTGVKKNSLFLYYTFYNAVVTLDKQTLEFQLIN